MNTQQQANTMRQVYAKAWTDQAFRQALLADAAAALRAEGVHLPAGVEVVAVENTDTVLNLVLPDLQAEGELSDDQLDDVSGGLVGLGLLLALGGAGVALAVGAGLASAAGGGPKAKPGQRIIRD